MPINPDILLNKDLEEVEGYWSEERIILYNIAVGSSQDPMNKSDLKFTVGPSPKVLPSFAACIYPMESFFSIIDNFRSPHLWKREGENWKLLQKIY